MLKPLMIISDYDDCVVIMMISDYDDCVADYDDCVALCGTPEGLFESTTITGQDTAETLHP